MKKFIVTEEQNLKNFTDNTYPQGSLYYNRLLKNKDIRVNGVKVDKNVFLKRGDEVVYYTNEKQESVSLYDILYEDNEVILVDKESGVNAEAVFASLSERGETYFIHRLDRNTQGLILFAKTKQAESILLKAFKDRTVEKKYEAIVFGKLPKAHDTLTACLKKDEKTATVKVSPNVGEKIVTEYEVEETNGEMSKVLITLHTGKTHQIRAHMAYVHCPVVGDEKYGDNQKNEDYHAKRQMLLSKHLIVHAKLKIDGKKFSSHKKLDYPTK